MHGAVVKGVFHGTKIKQFALCQNAGEFVWYIGYELLSHINASLIEAPVIKSDTDIESLSRATDDKLIEEFIWALIFHNLLSAKIQVSL